MMPVAIVGAGTNGQPHYYPPMSPAHRHIANMSPIYCLHISGYSIALCSVCFNAALATYAMCWGSSTLPNHVLDTMLVDAEFQLMEVAVCCLWCDPVGVVR
jgi:hypothetical protein